MKDTRLRDSGSFEVASDVGENDVERTSFFGEIDVSRLFITKIIFLLIEEIKELNFVIRIIKILMASSLESFE